MCTQDDSLKEKLRACDGAVPIVFAHTSGLQMEPPPDAAAGGLTSQQESVKGLSAVEQRALGLEAQDVHNVYKVRTSVKFKKKSGGKNPLSNLKKKKKTPLPRVANRRAGRRRNVRVVRRRATIEWRRQ